GLGGPSPENSRGEIRCRFRVVSRLKHRINGDSSSDGEETAWRRMGRQRVESKAKKKKPEVIVSDAAKIDADDLGFSPILRLPRAGDTDEI
ncbi:hypothetical protein FCV25MIE_14585, partial [Fagus crenata]